MAARSASTLPRRSSAPANIAADRASGQPWRGAPPRRVLVRRASRIRHGCPEAPCRADRLRTLVRGQRTPISFLALPGVPSPQPRDWIASPSQAPAADANDERLPARANHRLASSLRSPGRRQRRGRGGRSPSELRRGADVGCRRSKLLESACTRRRAALPRGAKTSLRGARLPRRCGRHARARASCRRHARRRRMTTRRFLCASESVPRGLPVDVGRL